MDVPRFIDVIKQFPEVWDRNNACFREPNLKNDAWHRIGEIMNTPVATCRDTFKSLREKYVREREKQNLQGEKYIPWPFLESFSFLDNHIILRKQPVLKNEQKYEETPTNIPEENPLIQFNENYSDFDKNLISFVQKATPIWDRKNNGYPSKQVKHKLWENISQAMKKDINVCMTRWKGLREKYIRQKSKYQDGETKWEFLDDMSFLDQVIQYRRKNCEPDYVYRPYQPPTNHHFQINSSEDFYDEGSVHDSSSNDFLAAVKNEDCVYDNTHDSSYDSGISRKRSASDNFSESSYTKKDKQEETVQKTPEVMFGELIAAMLAKKPEKERNVAMIEIMKVLTK